MVDYIVTARNNKTRTDVCYITDREGAYKYAAYLKRYKAIYSDIHIVERKDEECES